MGKIIIDGREALPIRLIPFIAGWGDFAPDGMVRMLAHRDKFYRVRMTAYQLLNDGTYREMYPKEWDVVMTYLEVLTNKLKKEDEERQVENLNYETWQKQAIEKLPSSAFVWLDDFNAAFDNVKKQTIFATFDGKTRKNFPDFREYFPAERAGDKELNLSPLMTTDQTEIIFEGFVSLEPSKQDSGNNELVKMKRNALIALLEAEGYESVEVAFRHSSGKDGLSAAAKHEKHGYWYVEKARKWFAQEKSKSPHEDDIRHNNQLNKWSGLEKTTHKIK